ncbi:YcxB family protein [Rhodanobacter sp. FDAARGOS 1247]|uniref:YcxB family protein n=1 Tax=Rhodanobacter sp. FDAARGOS 1247 TaxID=2778082 RepID=UPI00194F7208|nr:YcxB family protein [Rhodanobacter sp. FDAARGOS 1247]QRP63234.1 YcxB family protein [Rhodanobacter sp. FDAARGOS 1247]
MDYILRYRSTRSEIWRWYWRAWKTKYWWQQCLLAAFVVFVALGVSSASFSLRQVGTSFAIALPLVIVGVALRTQILFKKEERVLSVGPFGWSTQIGNKSGARSWTQVAKIQETHDAVVIVGTNGNALIIPSRAFPDTMSQQQFLIDVQSWHSGRGV